MAFFPSPQNVTIRKFQSYPAEIKPKLDYLRTLILETATEEARIKELEETLK